MATFHHFECTNPKCNFYINTEPYGHFALMSGLFMLFRCPNCKNIQSAKVNEIDCGFRCDKCDGELYSWNPIDCKCPKCNSALEEAGDIMMAD